MFVERPHIHLKAVQTKSRYERLIPLAHALLSFLLDRLPKLPERDPFLIRGLHNRFRRMMVEAEVESPVTPHGLRHTAGSVMGSAGVPLATIREIMGHWAILAAVNPWMLRLAGSVADAITLFEKFEEKLDRYPGNLPRAAVELAKDWRSDRVLCRLEALLVVADADHIFLLSGSGELIEPDDGILAVGSGGNFALAAARALITTADLSAKQIVQRGLEIAAEICVFTNPNITIVEPS